LEGERGGFFVGLLVVVENLRTQGVIGGMNMGKGEIRRKDCL